MKTLLSLLLLLVLVHAKYQRKDKKGFFDVVSNVVSGGVKGFMKGGISGAMAGAGGAAIKEITKKKDDPSKQQEGEQAGKAPEGAPTENVPSKPMPVATKEYKNSIFYKCYHIINNDQTKDIHYQQCFCMMFPEDNRCDACASGDRNPKCCEKVLAEPKKNEQMYLRCCELYMTVKECKCSFILKNKESFPQTKYIKCQEESEYLKQYRR